MLQSRIGAVYGGGGAFGIGYGLGAAHAIEERTGIALGTVPAVGTSAGSWVAASLAVGLTWDDFAALDMPRVPSLRPGLLYSLAHELFGDARARSVRAGAVRVQRSTHHLLDGGRSHLAHLVAASSAVPGLFAPHRLGRSLYVDGGVRSMASVHRAPPVEHLIVVLPVAGAMFAGLGRLAELALPWELRAWSRRNRGGRAHVLRPDRHVASLVRHPLDLFDQARALEAYWRARDQVTELFDHRPDLAPLLQLAA